jgi:hypothetical protein
MAAVAKAIVLATSLHRSGLHEPGGDGARSSIPSRLIPPNGRRLKNDDDRNKNRASDGKSWLPSAGNSAAGRIARLEARLQADLSIAVSLPWASRWSMIWTSHFNS